MAHETVTITKAQLRALLSSPELKQVLGGVGPAAPSGVPIDDIWEWFKDVMRRKKPGEKVPRPGHGLPSKMALKLLLVGLLLYSAGKGGRHDVDAIAKWGGLGLLAYAILKKGAV